jgi:hypothetical protein
MISEGLASPLVQRSIECDRRHIARTIVHKPSFFWTSVTAARAADAIIYAQVRGVYGFLSNLDGVTLMFSRKVLIVSVAAGFAACPMLVSADSDIGVGNGSTATAQLDFQIVIPEFVYFQVGDATAGNVDLVDFDLGVAVGAQPGDGNPVSATGANLGVIPVVLITNAASVDLAATGLDLDSGTDTLPLADITVVAGAVPHPVFNGAATNVAGGVYNDTWTFTYSNPAAAPPAVGTYTTTVTYTATTL